MTAHDVIPTDKPTSRSCHVEHHLGTAISLMLGETAGCASGEMARRFFDTIARHEEVLSRFRPESQLSRLARGDLSLDDTDPAVREVLTRCEAIRALTRGAFDHQPRRRSGDRSDPVLDPNAFAKGWIVEELSLIHI